MTDKNLQTIEQKLRITQLAFAIIVVLLAGALAYLVTTKQQPEPPTRRLRIGGVTMDEKGVTAVGGDPHAAPNFVLRASPSSAFLAIGAGEVEITQGVDRDSPIVTIAVNGRVKSTLEVNTDNGGWTVVRSYNGPDGRTAKTERVQLVQPMSP